VLEAVQGSSSGHRFGRAGEETVGARQTHHREGRASLILAAFGGAFLAEAVQIVATAARTPSV
jgi:hypothetical protein